MADMLQGCEVERRGQRHGQSDQGSGQRKAVRASCPNIQAMPTPATAIASQVLAGSR